MSDAIFATVYAAFTILLALRADKGNGTIRYHTSVALVCSVWPALVAIVMFREMFYRRG